MTPNSLFPAFCRLDYHSVYGAHAHIIPTLEWFPTSITGTLGSYAGHNGTPIDAEAMIQALVDVIVPFHKSTTVFDLATIFTMATPTAPAVPRGSAALGDIGTAAASIPDKATQFTLNMRTSLNGKMKLVMLDAPTGATNFDKQLPGSFSGTINALVAELELSSNAWAGRDGGQPGPAISMTLDLNDALRERYGMG